MSAAKAVFVLVHGASHNHSAWDAVTPILKAAGFAALTLDLPGAGVNGIPLTSLGHRTFDLDAFAAERSPIADGTQEERTQAVEDCAVPLTGQDHMIAAVDGTIGGKTMTHTLESSHAPFLSQPAALSQILIDIGVQSAPGAGGLDT